MSLTQCLLDGAFYSGGHWVRVDGVTQLISYDCFLKFAVPSNVNTVEMSCTLSEVQLGLSLAELDLKDP